MTRTDFHAFTPASVRPVMTFGTRDQAERYRDRMAAIGCQVTLKRASVVRRDA